MIWRTFLRQRLPTALCPERGDHGGSELYWYRQMWRSAKFVEGFTQYSVQFSYSVVSDSLQPHEPQHARPASPSPTPGVYTNPCPSSQWCHPIISSSVIPFSSCPQSFPAAGSFPMSQFFRSSGQSIEFQRQHQSFQWIFRTYFLYDWLVGSPCSPLQHHSSKASILRHLAFFVVQLSHPYMTTGKTIALTRRTLLAK